MKTLAILLLFTALNSASFAQFGVRCVDSTRIQSNSPCSTYGFLPVCGCNGITYRNECFATSEGLTSWQNTICEEFGLDFYPNVISTDYMQYFKPLILSKYGRQSTIYIIDIYGIIHTNIPIYTYSSLVLGMPAYQEVIDLSNLEKNMMYLFVLSTGGVPVIRKFILVD